MRRCPGGWKSADRQEPFWQAAEHLSTVFANGHEILDPDAADAWDVHARLDGDDIAGLQRVGRRGGQARRLVDLEADAVAEAVAEVLAVPGGPDQLACHG